MSRLHLLLSKVSPYAMAAALACLAIGQATVLHDYPGAVSSALAAVGVFSVHARSKVSEAIIWAELIARRDLDGDGKIGPPPAPPLTK